MHINTALSGENKSEIIVTKHMLEESIRAYAKYVNTILSSNQLIYFYLELILLDDLFDKYLTVMPVNFQVLLKYHYISLYFQMLDIIEVVVLFLQYMSVA
jgi:hypothetical protein